MSDPVTNAEVEDVLSSIRRLVSEDKRPQTGAPTAVPAAERPQGNAAPNRDAGRSSLRSDGRLVLTPALRVAARDGAEPPVEEPAVEEPAVDEAPFVDVDAQKAAHVPEPSEASAPAEDAVENMLADLQSDDATAPDEGDMSAPFFRHAVEKTAAEETARDRAEQAEPAQEPENDPFMPSEGLLLKAAGLVAEDAEEGVIVDGDAPGSTPATLSAKIAALETAIGSIRQEWEPDDTGTDEYSGTEAPAMAWEDDIAVEAEQAVRRSLSDAAKEAAFELSDQDRLSESAAPEADVAAAAAGSMGATAAAEDAQTIDEDVLRELVGQMVRQELQGVLGERITRNVRKLVRREIHRALATQELE
ncbi:MAG: hypothetical protein ACSHWZ_15965 [Sulfitobacter sp.]